MSKILKKIKSWWKKTNIVPDSIEKMVGKCGLELVDNWRNWYRMMSAQAFVFIGAIPEIYQYLSDSGLLEILGAQNSGTVPPAVNLLVKLAAAYGFFSRLVKQKKIEAKAAADEATSQ